MTTIKTISAIIASVALICLAACNNTAATNAGKNNKADSNVVAVYVFPVQRGYGYSIVVNDKEFIKQDCIPAIQGNKAFVSEEQAGKTGKLVADKIRSGQLPTLTVDELNTLGITQ